MRGVGYLTPSEALARFRHPDYFLPLPAYPTTWAGSGGMDFFLGNAAQQAIFQLMIHTYGIARLTESPALLDLALWLAQSDNLHLIQWFGRSGPEAEVSAYFTPREWWELGPNGILWEQRQVYLNVIEAMQPYLPTRPPLGAARGDGRAQWARARASDGRRGAILIQCRSSIPRAAAHLGVVEDGDVIAYTLCARHELWHAATGARSEQKEEGVRHYAIEFAASRAGQWHLDPRR